MASYEKFLAEIDQAVRENCEGWGLPWDYRSALEGAGAGQRPEREERTLTMAVEDLSDEQLEDETNLARAQITAFSGIAARMDGMRHGERKLHGEVSELVERAYMAGQIYALLEAARASRGRGGGSV